VRIPARPTQLTARAVARLPFLPSFAAWVEAASQPAIMDTTKAKTELEWSPQYSGLEALKATLEG
jgi:nucleoside-diphosphate-sugar epimerase